MSDISHLTGLAKLVRYYILVSTTAAGSGHPTSSLSATDILTTLLFGGFFTADIHNPDSPDNDRLIFSKGHAAPLFYALYGAAGVVSEEELKTLRAFDSRLEGHPTMNFPYTEAATGSLGQGLGIGAGMALAAKLDQKDYRTFVLLGDSEMAEGSVWEAMALSSYHELNNLVAIVDVNRLGQRGETMFGHNLENYAAKAEAFGWEVEIIDGHDIEECIGVFEKLLDNPEHPFKPKMILAHTLKGKGVSFVEDQEGWHGKAFSPEDGTKAITELGPIDMSLVGHFATRDQ